MTAPPGLLRARRPPGRRSSRRGPRRRTPRRRGATGRLARRGLRKNDCIPLAPARAPAARPQIEPPGTAPPDAAAARSYGVGWHVAGFVKMTASPWLLLARRPRPRAA